MKTALIFSNIFLNFFYVAAELAFMKPPIKLPNVKNARVAFNGKCFLLKFVISKFKIRQSISHIFVKF